MNCVALRGQRGFSLIELMIALAIAAVLVAVAVPSFRSITLGNRLTTAIDELEAAINTARIAAIKNNNYAQFCSDSSSSNGTDALGTGCASNTGEVWILNGSGTAELQRASALDISSPLQLSGSLQALRFGGDGLAHAVGSTSPYAGTVAVICTSSLSSNNLRTIKMTGGSALTTTTTTGSCP